MNLKKEFYGDLFWEKESKLSVEEIDKKHSKIIADQLKLMKNKTNSVK
jgi:hypothetical protein